MQIRSLNIPDSVLTRFAIRHYEGEPVDVSSVVFCIIGNIRQELWEVTTKEYIQMLWEIRIHVCGCPRRVLIWNFESKELYA